MEGCSYSGSKRKEVQQVVYQVDDDSDSSDSSTTTTNYAPKRCKIENSGGDGEAKSCHQCKRNDKGRVVNCSNCEKKRYCTRCISNHYPKMNEEDFVEACPFCRDICNCKSCLRLELPIKNETRLSEDDKVHYSKYLLKRLLPFVRQFNEQQIMEKEMEARIRGLSTSDVKVQRAYCPIDERMNCNYCRSSIADYHRSCTRCSYDLCITCCQELRDFCLHSQKEMMQYAVPEVGYLHGETCTPPSSETLSTTTEMRDGDLVKAMPQWKPNKDGSISCPPESMGGCGKGILKLNQVLPDNWLSNMIVKAEKVHELYKLNDMPETPVHRSSSYEVACDNNAKKKLRKTASRDNNDNYLYSPSAIDIEAGDLKHFQAHWLKGEPVIVSSVLDSTYGLSWEPLVMSRAIHEKSQTDVSVLNCLNWCEEDYSVSSFFKGYSEGILDLSDWPQMLKLSDWPPSGLFEDHLPRHNVEFISTLPFKEYTHPQSGYLNLAVKLPNDHLMPDTGPKLYTGYGYSQELGRGDSVTKIKCHESDVVYVLTHTKEMTFSPSEHAAIKQLKEKHYLQDQRELYINGKTGNGLEQQQQEHDDMEELEKAESGALWDIYRRKDASKLREYLRKYFKEFRHTYCLPVQQVFDPIHDGVFYLNSEHKRRLKKEYGIEPWTVVQNLGDAVFIPAGCPCQVRNLKSCIQVSTGFVSPESVDACLRLTDEIRVLPQEHDAKEDKLGVKKLILYAMRQVLDNLDGFTKKTECVDISSDASKESGYLGSQPGYELESESDFGPPTQNVYARRQFKKEQRGMFTLRCNATPRESDFQKEANESQQVSHVLAKTVQPLSSFDSPGSCSQMLRLEPISCVQTEYLDVSSDSSKESGHLGSSFDLESNYNPATEKLYSRRQSKKDGRGMFSLRCDSSTPVESDFQKEAIISQEVSQTITKTVQPPSKNDCSVKPPGQSSSQVSYSQAPRSVSAEMVGFFKHLEEQIQEDKFDVYRVLPSPMQLDEEVIHDYEMVLKKHLSGRLLDLANDSNFRDFNKALHFLLACRRIPSHLQQGFLTLRWDLPNLTSRAYELHKEVNRGMVMPLAKSKEKEELKSILGKYRQVEYNLVELEKEKDANLLVIARLVEQMKDHNLDEIVKLHAGNEAIDAKINKFAEEAKALHKDATAQNYKVINLEAMGAEYEANVENAMNRLVTMELKWKERVESLDY